ncbi:hypothetical protein FRC19_009455 [Serendipita sp. 401]|nr:hypothetical protein FRC19_009455 [Serendipita sp. 401]KAG9056943.1 hypothetical protein FS842_009066 [Serendipita sp. 407]
MEASAAGGSGSLKGGTKQSGGENIVVGKKAAGKGRERPRDGKKDIWSTWKQTS